MSFGIVLYLGNDGKERVGGKCGRFVRLCINNGSFCRIQRCMRMMRRGRRWNVQICGRKVSRRCVCEPWCVRRQWPTTSCGVHYLTTHKRRNRPSKCTCRQHDEAENQQCRQQTQTIATTARYLCLVCDNAIFGWRWVEVTCLKNSWRRNLPLSTFSTF